MSEQHAALGGEELAGYGVERRPWRSTLPRVLASEAWLPERLRPGWTPPPPGRHAAPPRFRLDSGVAVGLSAALLVVVAVLSVPLARLAGQTIHVRAPGVAAPATSPLGPPLGPPPGNLVANWSFERGIGGWETVGPALVNRELGGHNSSASMLIRPVTDTAGPAGIMAPVPASSVRPGSRFEATAWVRAETVAAVPVALHLFVANGKEVSQAVTVTRPGGTWLRLHLVHQVGTAGPLSVELVVLEPVRQQAILVDEISVRPV
jgi:hypothetical protein